jgi:undecaprenyl-diphosphatase
LAAGKVLAAGYVVLASSLTLLGLVLTKVLAHGGVGDWDRTTSAWFAGARTRLGNGVSLLSTNAAATLAVVVIAAVVVAVLALRHRWREVTFLVVALTVEVTSFLTATLLVSRRRPAVEHLDATPPTDSYPSGHTSASVVLYAGLVLIACRSVRSRAERRLLGGFGVTIPLGVAVSRVYRGMHHPTDVLAGVALGIASVAVGILAVRAAWPDDGDERSAVAVAPATDAGRRPTVAHR